jgi:hypothetical protein
MNDTHARWWIAGLAGLVLLLASVLVAAQTQAAEGAAGLLGLALLGIGLVALLLVMAALWPRFAARARDHLESSPGKTFLVGLVNYVFLGAIALVTLNLGAAAVIGVGLGSILLVGTLLGLPAAAILVGSRLYGLRERETTRWNEIVTGGVALYLAALLPVVGWFLVLPALCLWCFGTAALTLFSRNRQDAAEVE